MMCNILNPHQECLVGDGSSLSLVQFANPRSSKRESRLMLGNVTKLFPSKNKRSNEDKKPRLLRFVSSDKLQSLRSSHLKEHKPDKLCNMKPVELELLLGNNHEADGGPLHPSKDNISRFFNEEKE